MGRGKGMQPFCDKYTSKMSVVEFEGSVSEAKTCKTTCVFFGIDRMVHAAACSVEVFLAVLP